MKMSRSERRPLVEEMFSSLNGVTNVKKLGTS